LPKFFIFLIKAGIKTGFQPPDLGAGALAGVFP
jgi:hypothetical protein